VICFVAPNSSGQDSGAALLYDVTLERRIRELCAQAVAARNSDEAEPILSELRQALRQHVQQLKSMVSFYPFSPVDIDNVIPVSDATGKLKGERKKKAV
jgi:hypothetical protein